MQDCARRRRNRSSDCYSSFRVNSDQLQGLTSNHSHPSFVLMPRIEIVSRPYSSTKDRLKLISLVFPAVKSISRIVRLSETLKNRTRALGALDSVPTQLRPLVISTSWTATL